VRRDHLRLFIGKEFERYLYSALDQNRFSISEKKD
jgi:hypothetical protein